MPEKTSPPAEERHLKDDAAQNVKEPLTDTADRETEKAEELNLKNLMFREAPATPETEEAKSSKKKKKKRNPHRPKL